MGSNERRAIILLALVVFLLLILPTIFATAAPPGGWPAFQFLAQDPSSDSSCANRDFTNIYFAQDASYWYFKLDTASNPDFSAASSSCDETLYKFTLDTNGGGLVAPGTQVQGTEYMLIVTDKLNGVGTPALYLVPSAEYNKLKASHEITEASGSGYFEVFSNGIDVAVAKTLTGGDLSQLFLFTDSNINNLDQQSSAGSQDKLSNGSVSIIVPIPGIDINKTGNQSNATPNQQISFTLTVKNTGDGTLVPIIVRDTLPIGLDYVSSSLIADGGITGPTISGRTLTYTISSLAEGGLANIVFTALVNTSVNTTLNNTVNATGTTATSGTITDSSSFAVAVLVPAVCGNGIPETGEACDDGNADNTDSCTDTCTVAVCSDGFTQPSNGEECDDANIDDTDSCTTACLLPVCGDTFMQPSIFEECDDGNLLVGDGCSDICVNEVCGDGITQADLGEACDDGNGDDTDSCTNACLLPACGDGFTQEGNAESCDDGNVDSDDGCSASCLVEFCGDGIQNQGEDSDENPIEECDDGNADNTDACTDTCILPLCGDGFIQPDQSEECDDGNTDDGDGCSSVCTTQVCSDTLDNDDDLFTDFPDDPGCVNPTDDDEANDPIPASCGNGVIDAGETCDGENLNALTCTSFDGFIEGTLICNAACQLNTYNCVPSTPIGICGDGVINSGEQCDGSEVGDITTCDQFGTFLSDSVSCTADCQFDTSSCVAIVACNDGLDNDGDGLTDLTDPGCLSGTDGDESNGTSACQDGLDNDSDGLTDLTDPGCTSGTDTNEGDATSQCQDGVDNDQDGLTDLTDPGCASGTDNNEGDGTSQCQDELDNDADGLTDLTDPDCATAQDTDETAAPIPPSGGGDGGGGGGGDTGPGGPSQGPGAGIGGPSSSSTSTSGTSATGAASGAVGNAPGGGVGTSGESTGGLSGITGAAVAEPTGGLASLFGFGMENGPSPINWLALILLLASMGLSEYKRQTA